MGSDVVSLLQDLYFDELSARTLLIGVGFPPARVPSFAQAATFWPGIVLQLERGIIPDGIRAVLTVVVRDFPANQRAAALLDLFGGPLPAPGEAGRQPGGSPAIVLCLFADPVQGSTIRIDREARLLREIEARGGIKIATRHAVRTIDIIGAMLDVAPHILHFAGHGTRDGRLMFDSEDGFGAAVRPIALAKAIGATATEPLNCVVLNSCYTGQNAEAFRGVARSAAGSITALNDDCALAFARGFYTGIAHGQPPVKAFESGRAEMGFPDCDTSGLHFDDLSGDSPDG